MDCKKFTEILDSCVQKARVAEESQRKEDWSDANKEADKLDCLLSLAEAGQCAAHACLAFEAISASRWVAAIASLTAIFVFVIRLHQQKQKRN